ncbi:MAG TPA: hypothetical protein VGG14_11205 [Candidatus Sulfotelmatobacter sp.]
MRNPALVVLTGVCSAIIFCSAWAHAQSTLPLGQVNGPVRSVSCPEGFDRGTACYSGTVSCPDTADLGFVYGVTNPKGSKGTIVFFNGQDGTSPGFQEFVGAYTSPSNNFQTVQVAWDTAWEDTGVGTGNSLKAAGCRPATIMNWLLNQKNTYAGGGMCAQGASAGSAAIAYALGEYGASAYLNHVELQSGPVLSDVSLGCNSSSPSMTVCPGNQCQTGQQGSWPDLPTYVDGAETAVSDWTGAFGNNACNSGSRIPQSQYTAWKEMSIVDGLDDSTFTYPKTSITGWLCSKPENCNGSWCQNNSAGQGQLFYQNITTSKTVYRVNNCQGTEGVDQGTVPALGDETGLQAIISDMVSQCSSQKPNRHSQSLIGSF